MCRLCDPAPLDHGQSHSRRHFFKLTAMAAAGLTLSANASAAKAPPKPGNVVSPEGALDRLMKGNERYVQGTALRHDFRHEREALSKGQNPFAGILSCADSRVAPEYAFDTARGDLFVVRVAGNFVNTDNLASFEYGVAVLKTPLILVLGHEACGAVKATISSIKTETTLPGHLPSLVKALAPAVTAVLAKSGDVLANAIEENVRQNVAALKNASPILNAAVDEKRVAIVGGVYRLATGAVDFIV